MEQIASGLSAGKHVEAGSWNVILGRSGRPEIKWPVRHSFHLVGVALAFAAEQNLGKAALLLLREAGV